MSAPSFNTNAIILRSIPHGETSVIVTALTQKFGIQSYIVKGVRKSTKTQSAKAVFFQPAAILDMVVYHHPTKQLNFIKEYKWHTLYSKIMHQVVHNAVALFCVELTQKSIKQPDDTDTFFSTLYETLLQIENASTAQLANIPIYYSFMLLQELGFSILDNFTETCSILDLLNGQFVSEPPSHSHYASMPVSKYMYQCLQSNSLEHLAQLQFNSQLRKQLLEYLEQYFQLHISEFGKLKCMDVMSAVLS